ncbi:glycosyltransferase [Duganella sp. CT11-25]|jgi:glycosyltransferase involved in cell wall biosynthesis|uniref:glycosyltransferase n=1 Tax=unclassified Duganella TaxID=2636909 RepID=UPI0039B00F2F
MRCLWIAREMPFPADSGDRIYSGQMARAFAQANGGLTFVGLAHGQTGPAPEDAMVQWAPVAGERHGLLRSLLSTMPLVSAVHATAPFKARLDALFAQPWDVIVFDHYASGWALKRFLATPQGRSANRPAIAYLAHNHEERVLRAIAAGSDASLARRLGFWQNYVKVRAMERYMVNQVDLVTAITQEDADSFAAQRPGLKTIVLTPGYNGAVAGERQITGAMPRHVIMVGSFQWAAKQENLRQFLRIADPVFARHDIVFDVVGSVPDALRAELTPTLKATRLHGFVQDPGPLFDGARIALVPEAIGGGFKLKFLDYLFRRMPVATLADAVAGLPAELRNEMIQSDTLSALAEAVVQQIDKVEHLDGLQQRAYEAARNLFQWRDRGSALVAAITRPA